MMFTSSDHYSSSMPMAPLITTKWKYNNIEVAPNCPRCASSNTKFCYYNNYSLSQPRYFCKACRRYWTKGGSLRNVPVGGGCRKSRRARAAGRQSTSSYADAAPAASTAEGSNGGGGGACIDMAAVFAKYVNQNAEVEESFSTGSSSDNVQGSCTFDVDSRLEEITTTFEYQKPLGDLMNDQMMMPQMSTCQDVSSHDQQFVYQDCNGLELQQQGVLCDHPDTLWSEGTTHVPNYGLQQPLVQVEDCGVFAADNDDQLRFSANLVTDNWAAFDLSAYDFYSTP